MILSTLPFGKLLDADEITLKHLKISKMKSGENIVIHNRSKPAKLIYDDTNKDMNS